MDNPPTWEDIVKYYRGSDLQNYFTLILTDELRAVTKPQMDTFNVKTSAGRKVKDVLKQRDERGTGMGKHSGRRRHNSLLSLGPSCPDYEI